MLFLLCGGGALLAGLDADRARRRGEALLAVARGEPISAAHGWFGADPQLAVIAADVALQANPAADPPGAAAAAKASLATDPLDPAALYILGALQEQQRPGAGMAVFRLVERLSRREIGAELALERNAVVNGDAEAALAHIDRILSTSPDLAPALLRSIAPALADPQLRKRFAHYAARPWFPQLIDQVVDAGQLSEAGVELLDVAARLQPPEQVDTLRAKLFAGAITANDAVGMGKLLRELTPRQQSAVSQFAPSTATLDPGLQALRWVLTGDEIVNAQPGPQNGLTISITSDHTAAAARRATLLPPGTYALSHQVAYEDGSARASLAWDMRCANPAAGQVHQSVAVVGASRWRGTVVIAPGCLIQQWTIQATGDSAQSGSSVRIEDIRLERIP